jgi:hypothetical protein
MQAWERSASMSLRLEIRMVSWLFRISGGFPHIESIAGGRDDILGQFYHSMSGKEYIRGVEPRWLIGKPERHNVALDSNDWGSFFCISVVSCKSHTYTGITKYNTT